MELLYSIICLMGGVTRVEPGAKLNFEYNR